MMMSEFIIPTKDGIMILLVSKRFTLLTILRAPNCNLTPYYLYEGGS